MADVQGSVAPGFERVAGAFEANFDNHGEVGASCAVHVEGRKVVDLWGGVAEPATGRAYDADALTVVFSCTKGAVAMAAHTLVDRGLLDVDEPVASYWPEFAQAGKGDVPVRWLLSHQVGLPTVDAKLTAAELFAWEPIVEALAAQAPYWPPGTAYGYHALTYGWLVGEVIRRISGRSLGTFFREEVAVPANADFWIGLPDSEEPRVAPMIPAAMPMSPEIAAMFGPLFQRSMDVNGALGGDLGGSALSREYRAAEIGGGGGMSNGRGLSKLYAGLLGPVEDGAEKRLLSEDTIAAATVRQTTGRDQCLSMEGWDVEQRIGLGFMLSSPFTPMGGEACFGHSGAGGSLGFADPVNQIGFGYAMNQMFGDPGTDPRPNALIRALYESMDLPLVYCNG